MRREGVWGAHCVGVCYFIDHLFRVSFSWRRHKSLLHETMANNIHLATMQACLYPAPKARSTVQYCGRVEPSGHLMLTDLFSPPSTGFSSRDIFIRKDHKPSLLVAGSSLTNSLLMTTPPSLRHKIPLPEWEESHICPRTYHHIHRRTVWSR